MKRAFLFIICIFLTVTSFSQNIKGSWSGELDALGIKIPLVINIQEKEGVYSATMDSPSQGAKGIPISAINFENSKLTFSISAGGIEYEGLMQNDSITGTFKQSGMSFPLTFKQTEIKSTPINRPQEPKPPFPYNSEDLRFENKDAGISLAGTLTLPKEGKNFPVAILVSGSGPEDRNEEVFNHKPFLVLSDYLTRNGIAVLRYDDRGVAESGGKYQTATIDDFVTDAAAAVSYLKTRKEINPKKIGIIGHSEGGTIAFLLAGKKNNGLAYIVSMAGMSIHGDSLLRMQRYLISKAMGVPDEVIEKNQEFMEIVHTVVNKYSLEDFLQNMDNITEEFLPDAYKGNDAVKASFQKSVKQLMAPEMKSLINCNPYDALTKIKCPVFALNGEKDLQVPADANLDLVKTLVKSRATVKKYPGLNHLFQHCETGLHTEYGSIEETISPEVLGDIAGWIKGVVK